MGKRVDALVLAFRVVVSGAVADEIGERQALADEVGGAELRLGIFRFALRRTRTRSLVALNNADVRGAFDPCASGGYVLEVVVRATFLATHSLSESVALCMRIAGALGVVREARLRRFDLALDFVGFGLAPDDVERIRTTRARVGSFRADSKDYDEAAGELCAPLREYRDSRLNLTGITVAAGNPLMARIYAKDAELRQPGREEKREIEHSIWREQGWDGAEPVTRVEFQCRGAFLDEVRLRDPRLLESNIDAVLQRCVRWLRIVEPDSNPVRARCRADPRWTAVAATVFLHQAAPIVRSRKHRGGARPSHVSGAVQSALAAMGQLRRPELVAATGEVFDDERSFSAALGDRDAEDWVRRTYAEMFWRACELCTNDTLTRHGARGAACRVASRANATIARFSSIDEQESGGPPLLIDPPRDEDGEP